MGKKPYEMAVSPSSDSWKSLDTTLDTLCLNILNKIRLWRLGTTVTQTSLMSYISKSYVFCLPPSEIGINFILILAELTGNYANQEQKTLNHCLPLFHLVLRLRLENNNQLQNSEPFFR